MWCSIQVVSAVEEYSFDEDGHADNQLGNSYGVALDNAGAINVSNSSKNNFHIFSPDENENAGIAPRGTQPDPNFIKIISIEPNVVREGDTVNVTITGENLAWEHLGGFVSNVYTEFYLSNKSTGYHWDPWGGLGYFDVSHIYRDNIYIDCYPGVYDVTIGSLYPVYSTLENGFTVLPRPTQPPVLKIDAITPNTTSSTVSDVLVSLRGTGFVSGTTFQLVNTTLGTIACKSGTFTRVSDTELKGNISLANAKEGLYDVVVTTPDGTTDSLDKGFTVTYPWFKPNPDGYQFPNFGNSYISWDLFENTYGTNQVRYSNGIPGFRALYFFHNFIYTLGLGGNCFGMSATSLQVWKNNRPGEQTWNLGKYPSLNLPSWSVFPSYPDVRTVTDWIQSYHIRQLDTAIQTDNEPYEGKTSSMRMAFYALKERMKDPISYRKDPYELAFWFGNFPFEGGHSVVPIRIEENPDRIVIYDNNYPNPNQEECLYYDSVTGRVTSPRYSNINSIALHPLSDILKDPHIPDLTAVNKWIHLIFTDSQGHHLGYQQGQFVSEIPGASRVVPVDGDGDSLETYYLGGQTLKTEVIGDGTGIGTVSIMRPNAVAVINSSVNPGSKDEVRVPQSGSSVEYISGSGTDSLEMTVAMDDTESGRKATVGGFDVDPSKAVTLSFGTNRDDVSVLNTGSSATVHFSLEQIGTSSGAFVSTRPLTVEAGSSVRIVPSNWGDLHNGNMNVQHDLGNDGSVDYSETFVPGVHLLPLPGYITSPTDPDGDGLYEDLNGNGGLDFNDVVLFFNNMDWIPNNEPVSAFDFNKNGQIDFNDVVILFNEM